MRRASPLVGSIRPILVAALAGLAVMALADEAAARPRRAHRVRGIGRETGPEAERLPRHDAVSPDAIDLGTLAPPTRLSTLEQRYGDAAFARSRERRRADALVGDRSSETPSAAVLFPCDPRLAGAAAYRCGPPAGSVGTGVPGYGLAYAYNPAYVTSPFSSGHDPREQAPVLPGVTGLFYAINGLAAGRGD